MLLLYAHTITPRLRYICRFLEQELAGITIQLTQNKDEYLHYTGPRINYSAEKIAATEYWIKPCGLLHEKGIREQEIVIGESDGCISFFATEGDFSFDLPAATFYLLSRYEEYLPHKKDIYGRYAHENSLAFREGFLDKPLINQWLKIFGATLANKFPELEIRSPLFTFIPTYDIDEAYSFKHKTWSRSAGAAIKDLLLFRFARFLQRRKVLNGQEPDPFDAYSWMDDLHRPVDIKPRYFFLVPERNGKHDKNILPAEIAMQTVIYQHAGKYPIGLHPSWQSGDDISLVNKEKERLEKIAGIKITASRQHYIRMTIPQTYHALTAAGITEDYSMGYGSINGFRASVASPFYWYDLENEMETHLKLYPFCYMEANSYYELKQSTAEAAAEMKSYYETVKKVNGTLITIWHNTFLGTDRKFNGWREVYREFFNTVT